MRKIPTLFLRDPLTQFRTVTPEAHPDCRWVFDGQGTATRKYDGTCVMFDGEDWWARREVKPGNAEPPNYMRIETDQETGKTVGWEPIGQSAFAKYHARAIGAQLGLDIVRWRVGTYELVGPKVNGNPERISEHRLLRHADAEVLNLPPRLDYQTCRRAVLDLGQHGYEGIVWHHPDGRMAKLKGRDFPEWKRVGR